MKIILRALLLITFAFFSMFIFINKENNKVDLSSNENNLPSQNVNNKENKSEEKKPDWKDYNLVMHALGGIDDHTHTNTKEAFLKNYANGCRVFEIDLNYTKEEKLIAIHDFYIFEFLGKPFSYTPPTFEEIFKKPLLNYLTQLTYEDVLDLMMEYPDVHMILDTKRTDKKDVKKQYSYIYNVAKEKDITLLERLIPQIYIEQMYNYIDEIYSFNEYIWSTWKIERSNDKIIEFLKNHEKIKAVAIQVTHTENKVTPEIITKLNDLNVLTYVHTLNDISDIERFYNIGVWGFFTDYVTENHLVENKLLRYKENAY